MWEIKRVPSGVGTYDRRAQLLYMALVRIGRATEVAAHLAIGIGIAIGIESDADEVEASTCIRPPLFLLPFSPAFA